MNVTDAVGLLVGAPDRLAWRPRGKVIAVTDRGKVVEPLARFVRPAHLTLSDLLANDWETGTRQQMASWVEMQQQLARQS